MKYKDRLALVFCALLPVVLYRRLFYHYSAAIWSKNLPVTRDEVVPIIKIWINSSRDGAELYVLFGLVLLCILTALLLFRMYSRITALKSNGGRRMVLTLLALGLLAAIYVFIRDVGFYPPTAPPIAPRSVWLPQVGVVVLFSGILLLIKDRLLRGASIVLFGLLLLAVFIPTVNAAINPEALPSAFDYGFVFAPALRLLHHLHISEIYFQYDWFLSLIALLFMKLKISLTFFPILGRIALYLFLVASFFFAKGLFKNNRLPYFLLVTLGLVKIYTLMHDPVTVFQVTVLRLDLWLILLWIGYKKGLQSRWLGLVLGTLILFHNAFGMLYMISYIFTLMLLYRDESNARSFLKKYSFNLLLPAGALVLFKLVRGSAPAAAALYQQLGIGFDRIAENSFYWYIPVLFGITALLLFAKKKSLPKEYFQSGLFLVFLALSNSVYFFGRSHEHNIINISASLLFVFYLALDLGMSRRIGNAVSVVLLGLITIFYSARISQKLKDQYSNGFHQPSTLLLREPTYDVAQLRALTNNSPHVYFMSTVDYYYYQQGNYLPQGYFSPYASWIYSKDLVNFLQDLLNQGYYVVIPKTEVSRDQEIIDQLTYRQINEDTDMRVLSQ